MTLLGAAAALPDLGLGVVYLLAWIGSSWPPVTVEYLLSLLLMEGVIINSAGFMSYILVGESSRASRALSVLGIGAAFAVMAAIVAWRFDQPWILYAFVLMTLNRMLGVLIGQPPTDGEKEFVVASWLAALLLFTACVCASFLVPVPTLGAPRDLATVESLLSRNYWAQRPATFLACGFGYFTLLGLSQATGFAWILRIVQRLSGWIVSFRRI